MAIRYGRNTCTVRIGSLTDWLINTDVGKKTLCHCFHFVSEALDLRAQNITRSHVLRRRVKCHFFRRITNYLRRILKLHRLIYGTLTERCNVWPTR